MGGNQPFPNGSTIKCVKDGAFGIDVDGQLNETYMCTVGSTYEIKGCVWSSICGWLVIMENPLGYWGCELHRASDFEIVET